MYRPCRASMKLYHRISDAKKPVFAQALRELGVPHKSVRVPAMGKFGGWESFQVTIDEDDPHWPILRDLAAEHGIKVQHFIDYSADDIATAPWLFAYTRSGAGEPRPGNGGYRSASFDLSH